ncbi:vitamin K epoxide reductase family protein [Geofilum sp. OHC36d9]|uniref:vitamin K epoxide reductase family protein n=1 Tax=Geofilum sp. OHC36d9 TaxID=3458413 RepID=UPI004033DFFF
MKTDDLLLPLLLYHFRMLGIKCNPEQLELVLKSAPSYPSLLSVMQAYTYFGIKTLAYRADFVKLKELLLPVVVQIRNEDDSQLVLLYQISGNSVRYYDASINRKITISDKDFCTMWTGVLVQAEKEEKGTESNTSPKLAIYVITAFIFLSLVLQVGRIIPQVQLIILFLGLLLLNSIGLWFVFGLLKQKSGGTYSVFDSFCHSAEAFDCDKVTQSKGAKIFKRIDLTDVGFVYFTTGIVFLLIGFFSNSLISIFSVLLLIVICSSPFIVFSIFYQKLIVKKWCPLCLGVVAILSTELVSLLFFSAWVVPERVFLILISFLFATLSSLAILIYEKYRLVALAKAFNTQMLALKLKRTPAIVYTLFQKQKLLPQSESRPLIIGNENAPITITTLLNPQCKPCKKLAVDLFCLLQNYPASIKWHLRLDGLEARKQIPANAIQLQLIEFFKENGNTEIRLKALMDWFRNQSLSKFHKKYPVKTISDETLNYFLMHVKENKAMEVVKVPFIWINRRELPTEYTPEDIPFLLTDLDNLQKSTM